jgi:hypothetical protein
VRSPSPAALVAGMLGTAAPAIAAAAAPLRSVSPAAEAPLSQPAGRLSPAASEPVLPVFVPPVLEEAVTPRKKSAPGSRPPIPAKPQSPLPKAWAAAAPENPVVESTESVPVLPVAATPVLSGGEPVSLPPLQVC